MIDDTTKVVYGSLDIGGDNAETYSILGMPVYAEEAGQSASLDLSILVLGTSESTLRSAIVSLEAAVATKHQNLTGTIGGSPWFSASVTSNTALSIRGSTRPDPDPETDTDKSRKYAVSFAIDLPETQSSLEPFLERSVSVGYATGTRRREVVISGVATAGGGDDALKQVEDNIGAWEASILAMLEDTGEGRDAALGWELTDNEIQLGPFTKIADLTHAQTASFRRVTREILANQTTGKADDTDIFQPVVSIEVNTRDDLVGIDEIGGLGQARALVSWSATWTCLKARDSSLTLAEVWVQKAYPTLIAEVAAKLSATPIVTSSVPVFEEREGRVSGRVTGVATGPEGLVSLSVTVSLQGTSGRALLPAHGAPLAAYVVRSRATLVMTITVQRRHVRGTLLGTPLPALKPDDYAKTNLAPSVRGGRWTPQGNGVSRTPRRVGQTSGGVPIMEESYSQSWAYSTDPNTQARSTQVLRSQVGGSVKIGPV